MTNPLNPSGDTGAPSGDAGVPQDPDTHGGTTQDQAIIGAAEQNIVNIIPENQDGAAVGTPPSLLRGCC